MCFCTKKAQLPIPPVAKWTFRPGFLCFVFFILVVIGQRVVFRTKHNVGSRTNRTN